MFKPFTKAVMSKVLLSLSQLFGVSLWVVFDVLPTLLWTGPSAAFW